MHATLRALSVTRLSQLPEHVPVVRWDWVVTGFSGKLGPLFEYAAFSQRIPPIEMPARPAGSKGKGKDKQRAEPASNDDVSHISCVGLRPSVLSFLSVFTLGPLRRINPL